MFTSDEEDDLEIEAEELMMTSLTEDSRLIGKPKTTPVLNVDTDTNETANYTQPNTVNMARHTSDSDTNSENNEIPIFTSPAKSSRNGSKHLDLDNKSGLFVWLLTIFAALGGFLFGYDTGVVSGAMLLLRDEFSLSSFWQEVIVSVTIAGAFVSALCGGFLNDRFGRKMVTILASFVFTSGAVVLGVAENITMLVSGRLILGIGIGLASMTVPVYIAESAPTHLRGRMVTINNLFITGGQCIASVMDGGFSYIKPDGWRYMLGLAGIPSLIQFFAFFFLPESPRWLLKKGRESEARTVLVQLRGTHFVDSELKEIRDNIVMESQHSSAGSYTIVRILQTPSVRRALIVGCGLQLFQQLSGINTVMYYSASVIKMSGVQDQQTAIWLAALTAFINFLFTLVGVWLVERIGRKKLIMASLFGVILSLMVLAVAFQLAAFNSPAVSHPSSEYQNTTCFSYSWCESCIENTHCGFCFTGEVGSINGTCLGTDPDDFSHAEYGQCENKTLPDGIVWAYDYCPTSYSWMAVVGLVLYLMFFAPGMGPMPWTINSEIYPIWARSTCNSLSAATNWIANLAVSMTFLTLTETLTKYGTYWLFASLAIVGLVFIGLLLPETKGQRLEEVTELFSNPWTGCCQRSSSRKLYTSLASETES